MQLFHVRIEGVMTKLVVKNTFMEMYLMIQKIVGDDFEEESIAILDGVVKNGKEWEKRISFFIIMRMLVIVHVQINKMIKSWLISQILKVNQLLM